MVKPALKTSTLTPIEDTNSMPY